MIRTPAPSVQFKQVLPPFVTEMLPVYMPMSTSDGHMSVPATFKKVKLHVRTTSKSNYKEQKACANIEYRKNSKNWETYNDYQLNSTQLN